MQNVVCEFKYLYKEKIQNHHISEIFPSYDHSFSYKYRISYQSPNSKVHLKAFIHDKKTFEYYFRMNVFFRDITVKINQISGFFSEFTNRHH